MITAELFPSVASPRPVRFRVSLEATRPTVGLRIIHGDFDAHSEAGALREAVAQRIGKADARFWRIRVVEIRRVSP